jgi:hypothetical protein
MSKIGGVGEGIDWTANSTKLSSDWGTDGNMTMRRGRRRAFLLLLIIS